MQTPGDASAKDRNLVLHHGAVTRDDREKSLGQKGCVVWMTGLSGSGKSTIARALEARLAARRNLCYVLDGDNIRHGLNSDLGFGPKDRAENIRRIGEVAALFADAAVIVIVAFISPYENDRAQVRSRVGAQSFVEVFVEAPLEVCEQRDPKGFYRKARAGEIAEFTGVSAPYEVPAGADVVLHTADAGVDACVDRLVAVLAARGMVRD